MSILAPKRCYDNEGGVIAMLEGLSTCGDVCCVGGECDRNTKLCFNTKDAIWFRGGCSDPSWESEACSQICPLGKYSDESEQQGFPITGAKLTDCGDGTWCCGPFNDPTDQAKECCANGLGFSIDNRGREVSNPTSTTRSTSSNTKPQPTTRAVEDKPIATLSQAGYSQLGFSSEIHPVSGTSSRLSDITETAVAAPESSSSPFPASSSGLNTGARIGIGIGSAVAVIAISVALFFFYRERKLRKQDAIKHRSAAFLPDQQENYRYEPRVELTGDPMRLELEGDAVRAELPAGEVEKKAS